MDSVDQSTVSNISKALGGGWPALLIAVLIGIGFAYLKHKEKQAIKDEAKKATDLNHVEAKSDAPEQNHNVQEKFTEAEDKAEAFRQRMKKENPND